MLICVTNRKLCSRDLIQQIDRIAEAVDVILLREKDLSESAYAALAEQCLLCCNKHHVPLWLNGFSAVAKEMQLPVQLSLSAFLALPRETKEAIPCIGVSIHSVEEAVSAWEQGANWLIAGHIYPTSCKPDLPARGLGFLQHVCAAVPIPVYAIGGVTEARIPELIHAGAKGYCMMSGMMQR